MIKKIVVGLMGALLIGGLAVAAAGSASAAPVATAPSATAATGADTLIDHACHQEGANSGPRAVICADIFERLGVVNGVTGAFFWGRAQYICADGASTVRCDVAKGLQYFYTSGYGWSPYVRFACPEMTACSNDRNYQTNPAFNQEFPTPPCRTLQVQFKNVTMVVEGHTFTVPSWYGTNVQFCV